MLHGTIRNDDFQGNTALQYWNNVVAIRNNVVTLCCAKNRRYESSWVVTFTRRGRPTTAKKCAKRRDARAKLLFCQSKLIAVFLLLSLPSSSSLLKLPYVVVSVSSTWCLSARIRQSIRPDSVVSVGDNDCLGFFLFHKEDTELGRLLFWIEKKCQNSLVRRQHWSQLHKPAYSTSSKTEENKRRGQLHHRRLKQTM